MKIVAKLISLMNKIMFRNKCVLSVRVVDDAVYVMSYVDGVTDRHKVQGLELISSEKGCMNDDRTQYDYALLIQGVHKFEPSVKIGGDE